MAEVAVDLAAGDPPHIARVTVTRTARRLMEGRVLVPTSRLGAVPASACNTQPHPDQEDQR